jgi:type I restriction enzyme R subunit
VIFEIELIKQVEVNVDYILTLVQRHLQARGASQDKEIRAAITRAIDSSPSLRNKKDLIEQFVDSLTVDADVDQTWRAYVEARRTSELDQIIGEENLKPDATRAFVRNAFRDGAIPSSGTAITTVLPPVSRFSPTNDHATKKDAVLAKLTAFFDRYFGLT